MSLLFVEILTIEQSADQLRETERDEINKLKKFISVFVFMTHGTDL